MTNIKTASGKEFNCDMIAENPSPPRLYLHFPGASLPALAAIFTSPDELPIEEFPDYSAFQSISVTPFGVNVALKKEGT